MLKSENSNPPSIGEKAEDPSDISSSWKIQETIFSHKEYPCERKKKSKRSEEIQEQICNGNHFIPRSGLHLNNIQFL